MNKLQDELLETWRINNRVNLYLLNSLQELWLMDLPASKGRNIGEQFGHIHNVRLLWIKEAKPMLLKDLHKIDSAEVRTRKEIKKNLDQSAEAVVQMMTEAFSSGSIKGFKPHPVAFFGYLLAHEAHHRGQIMITLKENNHLKDRSLGFALWQWGSR